MHFKQGLKLNFKNGSLFVAMESCQTLTDKLPGHVLTIEWVFNVFELPPYLASFITRTEKSLKPKQRMLLDIENGTNG